MRDQQRYLVLDAAKATGAGNPIYIGDHRHKEIEVIVAGQDAAGDEITWKVQSSSIDGFGVDGAIDFDAASTATNTWQFSEDVDQDDGSSINGSTGVTVTNSNGTTHHALNLDGKRWATVNVTAYTDANSSGSITVYMNLYND